MSSHIDSQAQFESHLKETGMGLIDSLKRHAQLAFAIGEPGQPIVDSNIEQLVQQAHGRASHLTETAILNRAAFEPQSFLTGTFSVLVHCVLQGSSLFLFPFWLKDFHLYV
jgi:hypothetical protein